MTLFIKTKKHGAFEAIPLGHDTSYSRDCFFGTVFMIRGNKKQYVYPLLAQRRLDKLGSYRLLQNLQQKNVAINKIKDEAILLIIIPFKYFLLFYEDENFEEFTNDS